MEASEAARALHDEIAASLDDEGEASSRLAVVSVEPPAHLGPDTHFTVTVERESVRRRMELPTGLAMAYLADEEAAVDEWKSWVSRLRARFHD
ncbi:MAG: hypothetical protein GWN99_14910 [Gemmatimonadetes bacterium]|uniref:Uncharacterized protein n=1 Tax=Candidatus Kutchimonas denitrificans TaxID=3056748 RepID=A0AAE4Z9K4_9BACT|nr:hypothetical protein [Gemmatimonadota bacterium]NIR76314.1 hypothetical protein [Candidatus Kutchimonas denitrificans]NIS02337.1 hypothetical protein [Gemmatimonadota bacterium]NIT68156.1 hypothetical protein [Gemmatimonadota bacterium]NIU54380.1 hypothetical protein [Gemmatimonadota bacterium]